MVALNVLWTTVLAALMATVPFAFQDAFANLHVWIACLAVLGVATGYALGMMALIGGALGSAVGVWLLPELGLVGDAGVGEGSHVLKAYGAAAFMLGAVGGAVLRWTFSKPEPGDSLL